MRIESYVKYSLFLSDFNETWLFSTVFLKINGISNFMKILPVGAKLFRANRQIDRRDETDSRFSQFCESA